MAKGCLVLLLLLCPATGTAGNAESRPDAAPAADNENQGTSATELNKGALFDF
jgi:hypothetical protein